MHSQSSADAQDAHLSRLQLKWRGGGAHQMLMVRQRRRCIAESQGCAATGEEEDALVRVRAGVVVLVE